MWSFYLLTLLHICICTINVCVTTPYVPFFCKLVFCGEVITQIGQYILINLLLNGDDFTLFYHHMYIAVVEIVITLCEDTRQFPYL